ncbi:MULTISPECIES: hypothetical protein [unclassified Dysgonomonas]|uniref:hypothetical protein n=1 Tax=unclassified Dysgonomonas TaxID=2630389 RepID=UPI0025BCADCF|nr:MULTISPECIES: hypothetical protein [unclassified Dysgonomonas]HMM02036.1 hypothetical protein [Dysgonomonas sp.]
MNPITLSIGHTYIYNTNRGVIKVNYIGPFPAMPGGDWHDFKVENAYQDEIITVSALSVENGDLLPLVIENEISPEEKKIPEPGAPDTSAPAYMESKSIFPPSLPDIKGLDIAYTKGGRLVTQNITGTSLRNAVLHAYSYLYKKASGSVLDIRIHAGGIMLYVENIRMFTPVSLLDLLINSMYNKTVPS